MIALGIILLFTLFCGSFGIQDSQWLASHPYSSKREFGVPIERFIANDDGDSGKHKPHDQLRTNHSDIRLTPIKLRDNLSLDYSVKQVKLPNSQRGHVIQLDNPYRFFSVEEPILGGCLNKSRSTVLQTAKAKRCKVATNAGFFDTSNGKCLGSVISNNKQVVLSDVVNPNLGITHDGQLIVGYMNNNDLKRFQLKQLVTGVIWLVRDGKSFVKEAEKIEEMDTQETGDAPTFTSIKASRTAIGHTATGSLIILQVDRDGSGIDLYDMAKTLLSLGVTQAINLDGGGSSTVVVNDAVVNAVTDGPNIDQSPESWYRKERPITTITCIREEDEPSFSQWLQQWLEKHSISGLASTAWPVVRVIIALLGVFVSFSFVSAFVCFCFAFGLVIFIFLYATNFTTYAYNKLSQEDDSSIGGSDLTSQELQESDVPNDEALGDDDNIQNDSQV